MGLEIAAGPFCDCVHLFLDGIFRCEELHRARFWKTGLGVDSPCRADVDEISPPVAAGMQPKCSRARRSARRGHQVTGLYLRARSRYLRRRRHLEHRELLGM